MVHSLSHVVSDVLGGADPHECQGILEIISFLVVLGMLFGAFGAATIIMVFHSV